MMNTLQISILLVIGIHINLCSSYKILCVAPVAARSHYILMSSLAKGLAEAGHNVTIISPFREETLPKNGRYTEVYVGRTEVATQEIPINFFDMGQLSSFGSALMTSEVGKMFTNFMFNHPNILEFLKSNESFDAVILEQFVNDATKAFAYKYKAPLILFSTLGATDWVNNWVGNPSVPSYIPDIFVSYGYDMSFFERVHNFVMKIFHELWRQLVFFPTQEQIMKKLFPEAPRLNSVNYNVSLVLINSHESVNQPTPLVPCMVQIGGFHISPPKKLSNDLQTLLDNAKNGVIYFSLGSNVKPSQMNNETKNAIIRSFSKLKHQVLWKWDEDNLLGQPANVKISKWFPQQDILAHPNVKLFITHGGLLSMTETIYHGIPILTIPIFGDQQLNALRAEKNGFGLTLLIDEITEDTFTNTLNKLIYDPKYRDEARYRSTLMHDRPTKPMDLAVYWTEFVIRHKGASHLRVAGVNLPWYQYHSLDVIAFLLMIFLFVIYIILVIFRKLLGLCIRQNEKVKTQ